MGWRGHYAHPRLYTEQLSLFIFGLVLCRFYIQYGRVLWQCSGNHTNGIYMIYVTVRHVYIVCHAPIPSVAVYVYALSVLLATAVGLNEQLQVNKMWCHILCKRMSYRSSNLLQAPAHSKLNHYLSRHQVQLLYCLVDVHRSLIAAMSPTYACFAGKEWHSWQHCACTDLALEATKQNISALLLLELFIFFWPEV